MNSYEASNQIAYSLLNRKNGAQNTVNKCNELGVSVFAYFPFSMGLLTGKYSPGIQGKLNDTTISNSLTTPKKTSLELRDLLHYANAEGGIQPLLKKMSEIAEKREKTLAQVALNYIISKGVIPIAGSRSVLQLQDNLGAMGWRLSPHEIEILESEADRLPNFEGAGFKRTHVSILFVVCFL